MDGNSLNRAGTKIHENQIKNKKKKKPNKIRKKYVVDYKDMLNNSHVALFELEIQMVRTKYGCEMCLWLFLRSFNISVFPPFFSFLFR